MNRNFSRKSKEYDTMIELAFVACLAGADPDRKEAGDEQDHA